jgi:myosin-1
MSLKKDDVVELIEKDDNGWWLVKMNGVEGWAPNNYLELVPQSAPAPPAAPPPPRKAPLPKVDITPSAASATAKPVSVFPGMAPSNGSATPWKKTPSNSDANSRPPNSLASKPPPPVATKPKPPVGAKPFVGKPTIPAAPRPAASNVKSSVSRPSASGQVDLAAAVSISSS